MVEQANMGTTVLVHHLATEDDAVNIFEMCNDN